MLTFKIVGEMPRRGKMEMRNAHITMAFVVMGGLVALLGGTQAREKTKQLRAVGYYIAVRADFSSPERINLFGASNLPPGAVLGVEVDDFIGKGSRSLNDVTNVVVGRDGLFRVSILPLGRPEFRRNLICSVVFMPTDDQPAAVLRVVGKHGEFLGDDAFANPQLTGNSRVKGLQALTVVQ